MLSLSIQAESKSTVIGSRNNPIINKIVTPDVIKGQIILAKDGDTYIVKSGMSSYTIRLHWADCPEIAHYKTERNQPYGQEALAYVNKKYVGKQVTVTKKGLSFKRIVGDVVLEDGTDVATDLVSKGLAQLDMRYKPTKELVTQQAKAKADKRGLWSQKNPIEPVEWRNGKQAKQPFSN